MPQSGSGAAKRVNGRPTMNDVARAAGVGLKTVSRVVNGEAGVQPGTAERVHAAIERLGFRRNDGARVLRRGRTATIGVVLEDVADPFYSILTRAIEEVAREHGFLVLTGSSNEDPNRERELSLAFCARRVDGLMIVPAGGQHDYLVPEIEAGTAVVFADRPAPDVETRVDVDTVLTDNAGGVRQGVHHLVAHGHRRIGYLGDAPTIFTAQERVRGYRTALDEAGIRVDDSLVYLSHPTEKAVRDALTHLLDGPQPVTALLTGNNRVTVAVLRELSARRVRKPSYGAGPALVGFDDFELADLLDPAVTVIAQDPAGVGRTAAELLFQRLAEQRGTKSRPRPGRSVELRTQLIPRGSGELPA